MEIEIKLPSESSLKEYTHLLQNIYENTYTAQKLGLTKECFSKEVFNTPNTQKYLKSNLQITSKQKTLLAYDKNTLIGSITIEHIGNECELRGFYVAIKYQNKGIGKKLFKRIRAYAGNKDIILDIYAHNKKTINIYKKWGFEIDKKKGVLYRHWPEWPEKLKAKSIYMRLKGKG